MEIPSATLGNSLLSSGGIKLPTDLFNSYKRYKANTDRLASWLGATAHSLGYSFPGAHGRTQYASDPPRPANKSSSSGRLKGKARKSAQKQASNPFDSGPSDDVMVSVPDASTTAPAPPTLLSTNQFIDLARFIVANDDPPITIPSRIVGWASAAIASRRVCAEWFQRNQDANVERSNQSHQHFIVILEQVVEILAHRVGKPVKPQQQSADEIDFVTNRFSALQTDDSEQACTDNDPNDDEDDNDNWDTVDMLVDQTLASVVSQPTEASKRAHRRYRAEPSQEDVTFALVEHLFELEQVRKFIRETCQRFVDGEVKLEVASLTTVAAVDKMQVAHDVLVQTYPSLLTDPADALLKITLAGVDKALGRAEAQRDGIDAVDAWLLDGQRPEHVGFEEEMEVFDFSFFNMTDVIESACRAIHDQRCGPGVSMEEMPSDRLGVLMWRAKFLATLHASWKVWKNIGVHHSEKMLVPVLSQLDDVLSTATSAYAGEVEFSAIPISTLFTTMVFFDIYTVTHGHAAQTQSSFTAAALPRCYAFDQYLTHVAPGAPPDCQYNTHAVKAATDWTNPGLWWCKYGDGPQVVIIQEFKHGCRDLLMCNVFAPHPWLAGTLSVASHMLANRIGSIMSQGFKYTLGAAHLYWAIQHMGLAGSNHGAEGDDGTSNPASWSWPLMDELVALTHDGEGVFFGGPPRSLSDACKEYMILLGCNASDVTCSYRDWYLAQTKGVAKKMNQSRHDGRLKFSSKRTSPFVHPDKFAGGLWRTRVFLRPLVERVTRSRDAVQSTEAWEAAVRDTAAWGKARTFDTAEIKSDSAANSGTLFKSLSYLRAQLAAEFPSLSVNVLLLHVQSYRILSHVRSRLAGHIGLKGKSLNYSQEDAGVATWAAAPLHMLAAEQDPFFRHQASPSKVKTERDLAMTLLNEIKDLIQGMTDEYSEVLSNEFDSGTFPA